MSFSILTGRARAARSANGDAERVAVRLVELDHPLDDLNAGASYAEALLLLRLHGEPLGVVRIALAGGFAGRAEVAQAVVRELGDRIADHDARYDCLRRRPAEPQALLAGLGPDGEGCGGEALITDTAPSVDVIVPTAGRPGQIRGCLESLRRLEYPRFRILVVDNRPQEDGTRAVVEAVREEDDRIHYVAEPRPGSSVARNRGIAESSAEILAFTDDDVAVDPQWLAWLAHGFQADPSVTVVTGLVMPTDMNTPAQRQFEEQVGFGKGFARRTFDMGAHRAADVPLYPYWGATFGSGNSMAFRRTQLLALGGFDPALGAGSPARSGADIESFSHAILRGGRLVYEPRALCWHDHRSDEAALERQLFGYWVGFTAILTKWAIRRPFGLGAAVVRALATVAGAQGSDGRPVPRELRRFGEQLRMSARRSTLGLQLKGYALGPAMYFKSWSWARRLALHEALGSESSESADASEDFRRLPARGPVAHRLLDLDAPLQDIDCGRSRTGEPYRALLIVVRLDARPLGEVRLPLGADQHVSAATLAEAVRTQLGAELREAFAARGEDPPAAVPPEGLAPGPSRPHASEPAVTVVVPTCRSPLKIERCVRSVLASDYGRFDIVVVENRPGTAVTRELLQERFGSDERVRYVEEPRVGAAWARNRGLAEASGEIVAFVDDDIVVDPAWLRMAAAAFAADPGVGCVTGLILPLGLDTPAQVLREQLASFGKGFNPARFSLPETRGTNPLFPFTPGHVGSAANTLARTDLVQRLGGFDTRLGPGTLSLGGNELDLYIRVIYSGAAIAYEPAVIVWHDHPDGSAQLQRYAFRFGVGLGATLTKQLLTGPERLRLLRSIPAGVRYALNPGSRKNVGKGPDYPRRLDTLERLGMLVGPAAYLASLTATGLRGPGQAEGRAASRGYHEEPMGTSRRSA
jgi:GT2 family glycosyltransferase